MQVSLNIKSKYETEEPLEAFEEVEELVEELEEGVEGAIVTSSQGENIQKNRQLNQGDFNLEKYMDYIPEKRDQDARMVSMFQQQGPEV